MSTLTFIPVPKLQMSEVMFPRCRLYMKFFPSFPKLASNIFMSEQNFSKMDTRSPDRSVAMIFTCSLMFTRTKSLKSLLIHAPFPSVRTDVAQKRVDGWQRMSVANVSSHESSILSNILPIG